MRIEDVDIIMAEVDERIKWQTCYRGPLDNEQRAILKNILDQQAQIDNHWPVLHEVSA